ncbi:hypothetical protein KAT36_04410 [Candidatus Pacearchaeota archaeon]|nr:hypothetical protein [Candidatus Pacearchaeota archaeon]
MKTKELSIIEDISNLENKINYKTNEKSFVETSADWYFAPKSFERSGKLYEILGVRQFKKLAMGTLGKLRKRGGDGEEPSNYFIGRKRDLSSLKKFEIGTRINETIHAPFTIYFGHKLIESLGENNYGVAIISGIGLLTNGYCTMLQRYNRGRIYNTLNKFAGKPRHSN